jgi:hypothetical protein
MYRPGIRRNGLSAKRSISLMTPSELDLDRRRSDVVRVGTATHRGRAGLDSEVARVSEPSGKRETAVETPMPNASSGS